MSDPFTTVCEQRDWKYEDGQVLVSLPEGRHQSIFRSSFVDHERTYVRLHTVIGSTAELGAVRMEAALRLNFTLRRGAFALDGKDLVLTETFVLADLDTADLVDALEYLAVTADRFERQIFGTDVH